MDIRSVPELARKEIQAVDSRRTSSPRRQRVRDATVRELITVSRGILQDHGIDALTIRAVAREMGMTAPGVYRYFASHRCLINAVIVASLEELTEYIASAVAELDPGDSAGKLIAASRALWRWGVQHAREFQLSLIASDPGQVDPAVSRARGQVGKLFAELFAEVWREYRPREVDLGAALPEIEVLAKRLLKRLQVPLPSASAEIMFTRCWLKLYGMVSIEALGLTRSIGDETGVLFEAELADLARMLGLPESAMDSGRTPPSATTSPQP